MLPDPRPARLARRRRPVSAFRPIEALERRELLTAASSSEALAILAGHHAAHGATAHIHRLPAHPISAAVVTGGTATATHHAATAHHAAAAHHAATPARATAHRSTLDPMRLLSGFRPIHQAMAGADGSGNEGTGSTTPVVAATYTPIPGAYTPTQIRTAYGLSSLPNQGQGMTIGIVDEFDDPNITSDANVFSAQYNLPQFNTGNGPTLTVYQDTTFAPVTSAAGTGVGGETSLDVEWAHAMAPQANILLVEVPFSGSTYAQIFAELLHGVQYAASQGAAAVSLSYGIPEQYVSGKTSQNNTYLASGAAANTVVTISTGDDSTPSYPATSPNAIGVGGTSLYLASIKGRYAFETAWGGLTDGGSGGGGQSGTFASPTYQTANGVTTASGVALTRRAIPDISMLADPVTGVSYYDSLDVTSQNPNPWGKVGGTSLAAPLFAGMVTLAQQNRVATGRALLNSVQLNNEIYLLYNSPTYSTFFHDITLGNNKNVTSDGSDNVTGYNATTGYDLATGVGTPIGNTLVPLLSTL